MAWPIPLAPPVTRTRLPLNSVVSCICGSEVGLPSLTAAGNGVFMLPPELRNVGAFCSRSLPRHNWRSPVTTAHRNSSVQTQGGADFLAFQHPPEPIGVVRRLEKRVIAVNGRVLA